MHIAFLGTPEPAVASLRALHRAGHDVDVVITRPDRRRGRGSDLSASPVKIAALELGLRVGHSLSDLGDVQVERGIVVAYGAMIPASLLQRIPMLNVHFSLLPRWRGAAPVELAILAGDVETGVSIITLDEGLDTGPVHTVRRVNIGSLSSRELLAELADQGAQALLDVLASPALLRGPTPQVGEPTYAHKIDKELHHVTPLMSSELFLRTVRLGQAFLFVGSRRIHVEEASAVDVPDAAVGSIALRGTHVVLGTAQGAVALEKVRPEGSRSMRAEAWWSGARLDDTTAQWS